MYIDELKLTHFRCFTDYHLKLSQGVNLIHGNNGSGKTSLLEAIYFLSRGQSFRKSRNQHLINNKNQFFSLFASSYTNNQNHLFGCQYQKGKKKQLKHNQENIKKQTIITNLLPVVAIDPDSYLFIDKSPQFRRSFFDWLVFHVKHQYIENWSNALKCQKHLSYLYKEKNQQQIEIWQKNYCHYAEKVNLQRKEIFNLLKNKLFSMTELLLPELKNISLSFYQGWSNGIEIEQQIKNDTLKNLKYGMLQQGIHKMDLKIKANNSPAQYILSRGQKKMLSVLFYLTFLQIVDEIKDSTAILCFDDMDSELDNENTNKLLDYIKNKQNQVIITSVSKNIKDLIEVDKMFHVKH